MTSEATPTGLTATTPSPATVLGRSLGQGARRAKEWVSSLSEIAETAISRAIRLPASTRAASVTQLLHELSALVRSQPEGDAAALAKQPRLWSLIDQLYATRKLGAVGEGGDGPAEARESEPVENAAAPVVDATVVAKAAAEPRRKKAAAAAAVEPEPATATATADAPAAAADAEPKPEES